MFGGGIVSSLANPEPEPVPPHDHPDIASDSPVARRISRVFGWLGLRGGPMPLGIVERIGGVEDFWRANYERVALLVGLDIVFQSLVIAAVFPKGLSHNQQELTAFIRETSAWRLLVAATFAAFAEEGVFRYAPYLIARKMEALFYKIPGMSEAARRVLRAGVFSDLAVIASSAVWAYLHVEGLEGIELYAHFFRYLVPGLLYAAMLRDKPSIDPILAHLSINLLAVLAELAFR